MPDYLMGKRNIPLDDSWDVIVAGGGPAGCAAAAAAAREGAKTLLLEATGALGGMSTSGLVPWFGGYTDGEKIIAKGYAGHVHTRLQEELPHFKETLKERPLAAPPIDPEIMKRIYDEMVTGAGADILFNTMVASVEQDEHGQAETLIVSNKNGLTAYKANVYIDCTGDADLAAWAGAEVKKGDENGGLQPATHCFIISNIDEELLAKGPRIHWFDADSPIWTAVRSNKYPLIEELHACSMKLGPETYGFNTGHIYGVDNTDPESITESLLHGRQMAGQYFSLFREHLPAFKNAVLSETGSLMGIRETRRIIGDYCLTVDDYKECRSFPDEICRNAYGIDVHNCSREKAIALTEKTIDELKERLKRVLNHMEAGKSFGVPYRCLTPRGLDNVLVAGRCISTDRQANGSIRIMACCLNTGEAAGIAAAMAAADSGNVHAVRVDKLRETLKAYGAYLPDPADAGGSHR